MSILKNFRNPWEDDNEVLKTNVLDTNVLKNDILKNLKLEILAYYFDKKGDFLGAFKNESDHIKIVKENKIDAKFIKETYKKKSDNQVFRATLNNYSDNLENTTLIKTEAYSKLFTAILKKDNYDMTKVYNKQVSVVNGIKIYNNPDAAVAFVNTIFDKETKIFKISVNIQRTRLYHTTVSNVISSLGIHEYTGHGINRWTDLTKEHWKAYELQFKHSSWNKITNEYKAFLVDNYLEYTHTQVSNQYYYKKHAEFKKKYGHLKEFSYVWRY